MTGASFFLASLLTTAPSPANLTAMARLARIVASGAQQLREGDRERRVQGRPWGRHHQRPQKVKDELQLR